MSAGIQAKIPIKLVLYHFAKKKSKYYYSLVVCRSASPNTDILLQSRFQVEKVVRTDNVDGVTNDLVNQSHSLMTCGE